MESRFLKIGDIFKVEKGVVQSSKNIDGEFNFITASAEWKTHNEYSHDCEALVFAMGASGSLGRTHYVNGKFIASDLCFVLIPNNNLKDKIDLKFYFYYFNLNRDEIVKTIATGTSKIAINMTNFTNYQIPLPSIVHQEKGRENIERVESKNNELVLLYEKNYNYILKLRQSILREAFEGKLVQQDPNDEPADIYIDKIKNSRLSLAHNDIERERLEKNFRDGKIIYHANGWMSIKAELICDFITKGTTPKGEQLLGSGEIPFLKVYNIVKNKINFDYRPQFVSNDTHNNFLKRSKVYTGDIIMNIVGPPLNKVAIIPSDYNEWNINQALAIFRPIGSILSEYLYWFLVEGTTINDIATVGTAGQDNISLAQCREMIIKLPPFEEQKRIVEKVERLISLCDELEKSIEKVKRDSKFLLQSVLQEAFKNNGEENDQISFGEFIKQSRRNKGITVTEMLKSLVNVKSSEYTKIEEGLVKPDKIVIEKIAKVLKLSETEVKLFEKLKTRANIDEYADTDYDIKIAARKANKN
jgi:type I restriction enzyme S subunit